MKAYHYLLLIALFAPLTSFGQSEDSDSLKASMPADTTQQLIVPGDTTQQVIVPDSTESEHFVTNPSVESEETIVGTDTTAFKEHSPRKATLYSAFLPGLGQVYNRKYWKVPIVYAGIGVSVYFIQDNIRQANYYLDNYRNATDDDPNTFNTTGFNTGTLQERITQHRKWRDYAYLGLIVVYVLNIIDAQVDAHLFNFDVSKDLSLDVAPSLLMTTRPTAGLTLCLKL